MAGLHPKLAEAAWPYNETDEGVFDPDTPIVFADDAQRVIDGILPDVDTLAQIIRKVDGAHTLGAGTLAEAILAELRDA